MNPNPIRISVADHESLRLRLQLHAADPRASKALAKLRLELDRAVLVKSRPPDAVGLQTTVTLRDLDSGDEETYTLATPERANPASGVISVFAPLGTAILGCATGDEISWEMPGGVRRLRIERVSDQPAAVSV